MASSVKAIKYKGTADKRIVSKEDWIAIGVEGQDTLTWEAANDFMVSGDDIVDGTLDYFKKDREFSVVQEKTGA